MLGLPTNNHTSASSLISDGMDSFSLASFKRNVQFFGKCTTENKFVRYKREATHLRK